MQLLSLIVCFLGVINTIMVLVLLKLP